MPLRAWVHQWGSTPDEQRRTYPATELLPDATLVLHRGIDVRASAADTYRTEAIGVVLTGANEDGARGLAHIVKRGGLALIQDPKTAEIPIMPAAAVRAVPTAEVLKLAGLAPRLIALANEESMTRPGERKVV